MQTIRMTAQDFKERVFNYEKESEWKYAGELPAIIDFYADWCGPCKMIAPILDDLAVEYDGKLVIYKVDTDKETELAGVFAIQSIPMILFIPLEGQPMMQRGAIPKTAFKQVIEEKLLTSEKKPAQ
jgi:thioredoxin